MNQNFGLKAKLVLTHEKKLNINLKQNLLKNLTFLVKKPPRHETGLKNFLCSKILSELVNFLGITNFKGLILWIRI